MKTLSVGIGCRLHSSAEHIEAAVRAALGPLTFDQIRMIASIDTKADEAGLLEFCTRNGLSLKLFSREQIATIRVASPSAAAQDHLGVDGVCEPCALLAAQASTPAAATAPLLVSRTVHAGVTVAIASTHPSADPMQIQPDTRNIQQDRR
jgi:cobalamin biosynthesis protein CbiG